MRRDRFPEPAGGLLPVPDHLSYSQLTKLAPSSSRHCARSWAYDKLLGLPYAASAGMTCGKLLDSAVQAFWFARLDGKVPVAAYDEAADVFRAYANAAEWPHPEDAARYLPLVSAGLEAFAEAMEGEAPPSTIQERHEFTVRASDGRLITVIGFSDWIADDGTIVDLKWSGSPRWNAAGLWQDDWLAEKRDQLALYWMARRARDSAAPLAPVVPLGRVVVVHHSLRRKSPEVRQVDLDLGEADIERLVATIRAADEAARAATHPARPGEHCRMCSYADRCAYDSARLAPPTAALAAA